MRIFQSNVSHLLHVFLKQHRDVLNFCRVSLLSRADRFLRRCSGLMLMFRTSVTSRIRTVDGALRFIFLLKLVSIRIVVFIFAFMIIRILIFVHLTALVFISWYIFFRILIVRTLLLFLKDRVERCTGSEQLRTSFFQLTSTCTSVLLKILHDSLSGFRELFRSVYGGWSINICDFIDFCCYVRN